MQTPEPRSIEAERAVLGAMLIDPDAVLRVQQTRLKPEDFYVAGNGAICEAFFYLADHFQPIDFVTVVDRLGGEFAGELTGLINEAPSSVHAEHYALIVRRASQQRRIIAGAGKIASLAYGHDGTLDELYDLVSQEFFAAVDVREPESHLYGNDDALIEYLVHQEQRAEKLRQDPNALIVTGMKSLDDILDNVPRGRLHVIAARPGIGKTMYLEAVAEFGARCGYKIAFYHLEHSHEIMLDRRMARHSCIATRMLVRGYTGPEVSKAIDAMREWQSRIVYIHCPGWTAERVAIDMMRLRARGEMDIGIVDYLQKLTLPRGEGMNSSMLVGAQVERLKIAAENLGVPVFLGSQVSHDWKTRADKRPHMSDCRNSGEIEEKANQIVMMHRPKERSFPFQGRSEVLELYVDKNTDGGLGIAKVEHVGGRFLLADRKADEVEPIPF